MLAGEAALDVIALSTVVLCLAALFAAFRFSIPYALRRLARYPEPGALRSFARKELYVTFGLTSMAVLFLATGLVVSIAPDTEARAAAARLLVFAVVAILATMIVLVPIWQSRVDYQAAREARVRSRRETDA